MNVNVSCHWPNVERECQLSMSNANVECQRCMWQIDINIVTFVALRTPVELGLTISKLSRPLSRLPPAMFGCRGLSNPGCPFTQFTPEKKAPEASWIAATGLVKSWKAIFKKRCGKLVSSNRACQVIECHFRNKKRKRLRQAG